MAFPPQSSRDLQRGHRLRYEGEATEPRRIGKFRTAVGSGPAFVAALIDAEAVAGRRRRGKGRRNGDAGR